MIDQASAHEDVPYQRPIRRRPVNDDKLNDRRQRPAESLGTSLLVTIISGQFSMELSKHSHSQGVSNQVTTICQPEEHTTSPIIDLNAHPIVSGPGTIFNQFLLRAGINPRRRKRDQPFDGRLHSQPESPTHTRPRRNPSISAKYQGNNDYLFF